MSPQAPLNLTAADVMTPNPRTCSIFSTVLEAVLIFRDADCGAVPIVEDGKPVGVLTDRDVALALADHDDTLSRLPVGQIMSRGVVSVPPDASIDIVIEQFGDQGVRRLLVVDGQDRLLGIIGWVDIAPLVPDRKVGQAVGEVLERP
ncbi:MAG: CBS domain-containing protein [Planctomycetaceae bacterium]|nr:CBS domain-containing protein [Planctomycetaceae bacterium]MBV8611423.1 CBS domain-containing protein [Singulisphaera sp.]MBV8314065.1 CBS domain-containing protein [Planctomycetaceae bacterium]MBV8381084.1 CBS domain-containing protein [Planctomycetaceae bacterium]MBV8558646.1 CBS domain-containing protein [Planctomycetaceae bacterium]